MKNLLLFILISFSSISWADSSKVTFNHGWIKNLPSVVPVRAGYIEIKNPTDIPLEIVVLQSDLFEAVEIHETTMSGGMMKMDELPTLILPPKTTVELKPGGKHFMLMSPKFPLAIGDQVNLNITFSDQKTQTIQLEVKK